MKNIEEFNIAVAEIFGTCYREFPRPAPIYKSEIGKAIKDGMGADYNANVLNLNEHEYKVVEYTLSWLIQAGYIWAEHPNAQLTAMKIRLSPLGLEILNSIPESLQVSERLGEQFSRGARSLGKEALITMVTTALSLGVNAVSP